MKHQTTQILRNTGAALLALVGIPLLVMPGPAFVFFIAAVALADFRKKHEWLCWFFDRPLVRKWVPEKFREKLMSTTKEHRERTAKGGGSSCPKQAEAEAGTPRAPGAPSSSGVR